jgi:hypothetical protein
MRKKILFLFHMDANTFSKFDSQIACDEIAPDFIPSHNDLVDSLPVEVLEASYRETYTDRLFSFGASLIAR